MRTDEKLCEENQERLYHSRTLTPSVIVVFFWSLLKHNLLLFIPWQN